MIQAVRAIDAWFILAMFFLSLLALLAFILGWLG